MTKHARRNRNIGKRKAAGRPGGIPEALKQLCMGLDPELLHYDKVGLDLPSLAAHAVRHVRSEGVAEIRGVLAGLLGAGWSADDIYAWWLSTGSRLRLAPKGSIVILLTEIHRRLVPRPAKPNPGRGSYRHRR